MNPYPRPTFRDWLLLAAGLLFVIMTSQYRIDLPVLAAAVERYVASPEARGELARRAFPLSHPQGSESTNRA
jgi:hypothetical protein